MRPRSTPRSRTWHLSPMLVLVLAAPCAAVEVRETHTVFGATLELRVEAPDDAVGRQWLRAALAVGRRLEAELGHGGAESGPDRLAARAGQGPQAVSTDLYRLVAVSRLLTRSTGGAFDVTVGPLVRRRERDPTAPPDVDAALALVGAEKIVLHPPDRLELGRAGMSLDLRGVVRGYTLERMAAVLRGAGASKALLEFVGTTQVAIGPPPAEEPWQVPVRRGNLQLGLLRLRDRAAATVVVRRRIDEGAGVHEGAAAWSEGPVLDPRSGRLVSADRQATVVALDATLADGWATALVIDPDGVLDYLAVPRDVEALVFDEHGRHHSPRFDEFAGWIPSRLAASAGESAGVSTGAAARTPASTSASTSD